MITLFLFIFGAIIGSFLNVVGLRFRSGISLSGRSHCPHCGHKLSPFELIPIFSFVFLLGRCKNCRNKISWQYPLVELWTAVLFITLYSVAGLSLYYFVLLFVFCVYTVILIYDLRHKIIPDSLVFMSVVIGLIIPLFLIHYSLLDWLSGPILFSLFGLGWLASRGRALGLGDGKLALSIGLLLGFAEGISAIVMAFWIGTAVMLPIMLFSKKSITMKSEIPFAPFMILGAWASLVFHLDLFHVHAIFS